jgi:hypothetical protein
MFVMVFHLEKKIKLYSLMMNPTRCYGIQNGNVFSWNPSWDNMLKNKVQWLDLAFHIWPILMGLMMATMVRSRHDIKMKYSKPCLSYASWNYFWFLHYMKNDNYDVCNVQLFLSVHFESFHLYFNFSILILELLNQL